MNKKSTRIAKAEQYLLKCATPPLPVDHETYIRRSTRTDPKQTPRVLHENRQKGKNMEKIDATRYNRSANRNQKILKSLKPRIKIGYPNSLQIAELREIGNRKKSMTKIQANPL